VTQAPQEEQQQQVVAAAIQHQVGALAPQGPAPRPAPVVQQLLQRAGEALLMACSRAVEVAGAGLVVGP
jgi:predicted HD phosphohydrolase